MQDSGSTRVADLAAMIAENETVDVRMALFAGPDGWTVWHGEAAFGDVAPVRERTWRYAAEMLVERRLAGRVVADLLRGEQQDLGGLKVQAAALQDSANFQRLFGLRDSIHRITPWPRTEWEVGPAASTSVWPWQRSGVLVGDGPSFINFEAAFCAFFYGSQPSNRAGQEQKWRIIRHDRQAWLHRITISSDAIDITVKGTDVVGVSVELTTPTNYLLRPVGRTRKVRLRMPGGLVPGSMVMLRRNDEWLDYRYFYVAGPSRDHDASVIWDLPGADVSLLVAGGEGQYVEFKREVPVNDSSKKTVLKTVAAFASGEGGTVLFGVEDDAQLVGVDVAALDKLKLTVSNMIRNLLTPEPPYTLRAVELGGKTILLAEVASGGRWHAYNPGKPEFYVRRGASTVPARIEEITSRFSAERRDVFSRW